MERKETMKLFEGYLIERENAPATIQKYKTDVKTFFRYMSSHQESADGEFAEEITKEQLLQYKKLADRALCAEQCKFHAGGAESVSGLRRPGAVEAPQGKDPEKNI